MIDDLRRIHRKQIDRLLDLSAEVQELSPDQSRSALVQFATAFIGRERSRAFLQETELARASHREVDFGHWLWSGSPPPDLKPRFGWLSDWMPAMTCIRFDRRVSLPALRLGITAMLDEWAFSWPGAYASFESHCAMVVSLDYEVTCYDLAAPDGTPYR